MFNLWCTVFLLLFNFFLKKKKARGTQGGRQLNILFGCIASLHPEKRQNPWKNKRQNNKNGRDEGNKTWLRNNRSSCFYTGKFKQKPVPVAPEPATSNVQGTEKKRIQES